MREEVFNPGVRDRARSSGRNLKPDKFKEKGKAHVFNQVQGAVIHRNVSAGNAALSRSLDVSPWWDGFLKDVLEGTERFQGFMCFILSEEKSDEISQQSFWS